MSYLLDQDKAWMKQALILADQAAQHGEVPVGAILVRGERILAKTCNAMITQCDPTAHAEILALRHGAIALGSSHLQETTLYVTLEPCLMCLGGIIQSQVKRVVFGAYDTQAGAAGTAFNLLQAPHLLWRPDMIGGLYAQEAAELLRLFFKKCR